MEQQLCNRSCGIKDYRITGSLKARYKMEMKENTFNCFKVNSRLNMKNMASFFNINWPMGKKDYIALKDKQLDTIFKYKTQHKVVYFFEFGCMTFINFDMDEIRIFMEYVESIIGKIDSDMFMKFYEGYAIKVGHNNCFRLYGDGENYTGYSKYIEAIIAVILAKSTALSWVESQVDILMDEAERIIDNLYKGWLRTNSRKFSRIIARILRFEYESIYNIEILDRTTGLDKKLKFRQVYDDMVGYYELMERFNIVKNKVDNLRRLTRSYANLSYEHHENRLYIFEIFLLVLFPLSYLFRYLVKYQQLIKIFPVFSSNRLNIFNRAGKDAEKKIDE
ncbi:MAG TPA: RMD1 family protein [Clostridiales bacterium]|nr:RMD1 family protein [Clostridiales bacterium]